jgi:PAS domain S-box-containing protein
MRRSGVQRSGVQHSGVQRSGIDRFGIRGRSAVAAAIAVALAAVALAVALIATAYSQRYTRELSGRLVPAATAADAQLSLQAAQQAALQNAVTSGNLTDLGSFQHAGSELRTAQAQLGRLAPGDQPMVSLVGAAERAYVGWLTGVADPQLAALRRGDVAAARGLQAGVGRTGPPQLTVATATGALESRIAGEQRAAADALNRVHRVLVGALIAMIVVGAAIAIAFFTAVWLGLLRPFGQLNEAVAAVAEGDSRQPIPVVGSAELADLSRGVELMRTRLVSALAARERAHKNLRRLFELAPDALVAVARDGSIVMANALAARLFGYPADELAGRPADSLVPEDSRAELTRQRTRLLTGTRSWPARRELKATGLRRDGTSFPAEVRLSLLPTNRGTVIVAAIRDVTTRLALEGEHERLRAVANQEILRRRQRQSQRLESLGQLVGGVAHDFSNLLNVISGYADFTAERLADLATRDARVEPALADLRQVQAAAQQAVRVTRQLLTFARNEPVKRELLDLNEVVENAGQLLRPGLGEHIELAIAAGLGLWRVEADRGQLEQVLVNLAVNARDAMPGGGRLTIGTANTEVDAAYAALRPRLEQGRYCRLWVSDTGAGMDDATVERVFEPFFSTKPRGRGTGLGLATVYGIVSGLGGIVDISSEPGAGTTVSVLLPAAGQAGGQTGGQTAAEQDAPAPSVRGHGEMILLVEDEESLHTLASRFLTRNGYQVYAAADGADAVRHAQDPAQRIDLLVTDMVMPGMLGSEVVSRVRAVRPRLGAVFVTGYAQQVMDYHGTRSSETDIVQKPFTEAELLSHVRRALNRSLKQATMPRKAPVREQASGPGQAPVSGRVPGPRQAPISKPEQSPAAEPRLRRIGPD